MCQRPLSITSPRRQVPIHQMGQSRVACSSVKREDPGLCSKMHPGLKLSSASQQQCDPSSHPASLSLLICQWEDIPAG